MKKILMTLATSLLLLASAVCLTACGPTDDQNENGDGSKPLVTVVTANVDYHYQYDVVLEEYWHTSYMLEKDTEMDLTEFWTPPVKTGFNFLGWTETAGGGGDLISLPYKVKGSGGKGTTYNLYAKYEPIEYTVVYNLDGGTNHASNVESFEGKGNKTLYSPTKEGYYFDGWYADSEFENARTSVYAENNEDTTIRLYAKWLKIYEINYEVEVDTQYCTKEYNLAAPVIVATKNSYKEGDEEFTVELSAAYYKNHYFVGWTYEGQTEPVKIATVTVPEGSAKDLTFTAHYIVQSMGVNTEGIYEVSTQNGTQCTYKLTGEVSTIVVADISGSGALYKNVIIEYVGDTQPTVIVRDGVTVTFKKV